MQLKEIYRPVKDELEAVENVLQSRLRSSKHNSILEISNYSLVNGGKRLRAALVLLSANAGQHLPADKDKLINIAAAIELIHTASLIHDDVIDHSRLRRNQLTINQAKGEDVAIAFGDYLYATAFELIAACGNTDVLQCMSSAAKAMCEGELLQVCERDNFNLLKEHYLVIAKKKTAALFVSSCQSGGIVINSSKSSQIAFGEYGLNFGIAFQIVDDCLDLTGSRRSLGKTPGSDFKMGELTLPILNLIAQSADKNEILALVRLQDSQRAFSEIKKRFISSSAFQATKKDVSAYLQRAKNSLIAIEASCFKDSLNDLVSYIDRKLDL